MSWFPGKKQSSTPVLENHIPINTVYDLIKQLFSTSSDEKSLNNIISPTIHCKFTNLVKNIELERHNFDKFWELFKIIHRTNVDYKHYFKMIEQTLKQTDTNTYEIHIVTEEVSYDINVNLWGINEVHRNIIVSINQNSQKKYEIATYLETLLAKKFIRLVKTK